MANYGAGGPPSTGLAEAPGQPEDHANLSELDSAPTPWYRKRTLLALWALMVAILIVLIIYGLVELSRGGGGGGPSTTTQSKTPTRSSTAKPSTTTTTTPPSTTPATTPEEEAPPGTPDEEPPGDNGPAPAAPPTHHHHWPHNLPHIPSTITLPHTVITLPPGW
jgi:hypothetical protein